MCRCLDPYPAASLRCLYPFLPEGHRPHLRRHRFGTLNEAAFRGCSHSLMFRLPHSLDPQFYPPLWHYVHRAAGSFTPRNKHEVTLHEQWYRYVPESGNWHGGTCTRWITALSAAPPSWPPRICLLRQFKHTAQPYFPLPRPDRSPPMETQRPDHDISMAGAFLRQKIAKVGPQGVPRTDRNLHLGRVHLSHHVS